jgi:hypothetical protein
MILLCMYMVVMQGFFGDATATVLTIYARWQKIEHAHQKSLQLLANANLNQRADCLCETVDYCQCEPTKTANMIAMTSVVLIIVCCLSKLYARFINETHKKMTLSSFLVNTVLALFTHTWCRGGTSWGGDRRRCNDTSLLLWGGYCITRFVSVWIMSLRMYKPLWLVVTIDIMVSFAIILLPGVFASHMYDLPPAHRRLCMWVRSLFTWEYKLVLKDVQFTKIVLHTGIIILCMQVYYYTQSHGLSDIVDITFRVPACALLFHFIRCQFTKTTTSRTQHYMDWNHFANYCVRIRSE